METQTNLLTGGEYTGRNAVELAQKQEIMSYTSGEWCTFIQARTLGRSIKKGEKGIRLARYGEVVKKQKNGKKRREGYMKTFVVFNVEQLAEQEKLITV